MGASYYQCFICEFTGHESCFEKNTGEFIEDHQFCDSCVEEYFEEAPLYYWVKEDDGSIVCVDPLTYFENGKNYRWTYMIDSEVPTFSENHLSYRFEPVRLYRPKSDGSFKKRAIERIDESIESLKRFKEEIQ